MTQVNQLEVESPLAHQGEIACSKHWHCYTVLWDGKREHTHTLQMLEPKTVFGLMPGEE